MEGSKMRFNTYWQGNLDSGSFHPPSSLDDIQIYVEISLFRSLLCIVVRNVAHPWFLHPYQEAISRSLQNRGQHRTCSLTVFTNLFLLHVTKMDPLSAAASVIAVVQITSKVFDLCTNYYIHAKQAQDDIRRLKQEVNTLQDVLCSVLDLTDGENPSAINVLEKVAKKDGLLEQCRDELTILLTKLNPGGSGRGIEKLMFKLK
jgi:hypothetical protein